MMGDGERRGKSWIYIWLKLEKESACQFTKNYFCLFMGEKVLF